MADFSKDSFQVPACAKQAEGIKACAPRWGMGSSTRDQAQKVYISKSHSADVIGIDSPGPVYQLSGRTPGPKFGFGTNKRAGLENPNSYPPTSNDLLQIDQPLPDKYKHPRMGNAKFGTSLRTAAVNAPGLDGFAPGGISPGPAQYTANFGSANRMPPAFTIENGRVQVRRATRTAGVHTARGGGRPAERAKTELAEVFVRQGAAFQEQTGSSVHGAAGWRSRRKFALEVPKVCKPRRDVEIGLQHTRPAGAAGTGFAARGFGAKEGPRARGNTREDTATERHLEIYGDLIKRFFLFVTTVLVYDLLYMKTR
ncbi:unnamed protein product [Amoebophrya sp. A120]|nr:unnamed protein product [Amoebophrya sp. A120]|eukprot:GSA120T00009054001.1